MWPDNWADWQLWLRCQTQWRYSPSGRPTGLCYAGVQAMLAIMARQHRRPSMARRRWALIQAMERAALDACQPSSPRSH